MLGIRVDTEKIQHLSFFFGQTASELGNGNGHLAANPTLKEPRPKEKQLSKKTFDQKKKNCMRNMGYNRLESVSVT